MCFKSSLMDCGNSDSSTTQHGQRVVLELAGIRLVIDPWLEGTEVDYFAWFNTQWLRTPPVPYCDVPAFDAVLITQKYPIIYTNKAWNDCSRRRCWHPIFWRLVFNEFFPMPPSSHFRRMHVHSSWARCASHTYPRGDGLIRFTMPIFSSAKMSPS